MVCISFRKLLTFRYIKFHMHCISQTVSVHLYRNCSRFPTTGSCSSSIAIFFNQYTRSTDKKHAQRTSKSSNRTLFRSRPFRVLLFSLVSLHQPLNGTHALVEVLSFAWLSEIVSPFSFSYLQKLCIFCICTASVWCLICVEWNIFVCKWIWHAPNRKKAYAQSMRNSSFLEEQKDMLKRKKSLGLEHRHFNSETFYGIYACPTARLNL